MCSFEAPWREVQCSQQIHTFHRHWHTHKRREIIRTRCHLFPIVIFKVVVASFSFSVSLLCGVFLFLLYYRIECLKLELKPSKDDDVVFVERTSYTWVFFIENNMKIKDPNKNAIYFVLLVVGYRVIRARNRVVNHYFGRLMWVSGFILFRLFASKHST